MLLAWPAVARERLLAGRLRYYATRAPKIAIPHLVAEVLAPLNAHKPGSQWQPPKNVEPVSINTQLSEQLRLAVRVLQPELELQFEQQLRAQNLELGNRASLTRGRIRNLLVEKVSSDGEQLETVQQRSLVARRERLCPVHAQNQFLKQLYPVKILEYQSNNVFVPRASALQLLKALEAIPQPSALYIGPEHLERLLEAAKALLTQTQVQSKLAERTAAADLFLKVMSDVQKAEMPISMMERARWLFALAAKKDTAHYEHKREIHTRMETMFREWLPELRSRGPNVSKEVIATIRRAGCDARFEPARDFADEFYQKLAIKPREHLSARLRDAISDPSILTQRLAEFKASHIPLKPSDLAIGIKVLLQQGSHTTANMIFHKLMQQTKGRKLQVSEFSAKSKWLENQTTKILDYLCQTYPESRGSWSYNAAIAPTLEMVQMLALDRSSRGDFASLEMLLKDSADRGLFISSHTIVLALKNLKSIAGSNTENVIELIRLLLDLNRVTPFWTPQISEAVTVLLIRAERLGQQVESVHMNHIKAYITAVAKAGG